MNDIDDVLRRTYAAPPGAAGVRPSPEQLAAVLRAGHRRRARRQAAAGVGAAALTVGLLLGVVALRHDAGDEGIPADTTSAATAATTVPGATTPTATATGTTVAGPVAAAPGLPQFLAISTSGRIEVWARTGLVRTLEGCAGIASAATCEVDLAALSSNLIWFVRSEPTGVALLTARFDSGEPPAVLARAADGERFDSLAVAEDGSVAFLTRAVGGERRALLEVSSRGERSIGTSVGSAVLSGDGRVAYAEGDGTVVVRTIADGGERRVDLAAAAAGLGTRLPEAAQISAVAWSPDRARLLLRADRGEDLTWLALDLGARTTLRPLSDTRRVPACWTTADTVAIGDWVPSAGDDTRGPIALVNAVTGERAGSIPGSFGESLAFVCRGDGAVAMVAHPRADWTGGGDLVVINAKGDATRLGTGYATVLPLGSGPLALLDPATLPTPTTTVAPRLTAKASDAFAALTGVGKLEVWTPAGKVLTIDVGTNTCEPAMYAKCGSPDKVDTVALTERSVWFGGTDGVLWRAALDGGTAPAKVSADAGAIQDIAASADDAVVWFVRNRPIGDGSGVKTLVRRERGVETTVAEDATSVALSPDGTKLAYSTYTFTGSQGAPTEGAAIGELVVRDLVGGTDRRQPWHARVGFPPSLVDLRWAPDGTRLLAGASWEGQRDFLVPADLSGSLDAPAYLGAGGSDARSCWIDSTTVARGLWPIVYAEGPSQPADVVSVDVRSGLQTPYGVGVYADTLACRNDGSVALIDKGTAYEQPGELVVVRPGGRRTVLGRGYAKLFPG